MGKGEIARYEQFLLSLQCFQKACFPGVSKGVVVWQWVNNPISALTETSILYTDRHTDSQTHGHTDRLIDGQGDSSIAPKTFVLWGLY